MVAALLVGLGEIVAEMEELKWMPDAQAGTVAEPGGGWTALCHWRPRCGLAGPQALW